MESFYERLGNLIGVVLLVVTLVWVNIDARAIGSDNGRHPGLVKTQPAWWCLGIFLLCAVVLPCYLFMRVRYKRLRDERKAALGAVPAGELNASIPGQWPPPPGAPLVWSQAVHVGLNPRPLAWQASWTRAL